MCEESLLSTTFIAVFTFLWIDRILVIKGYLTTQEYDAGGGTRTHESRRTSASTLLFDLEADPF